MKHSVKYSAIYTLSVLLIFYSSGKGQNKSDVSATGPQSIVRNMVEDRNGNIWLASWEGVFRYDGMSYTNMTTGVSTARFFSALEDSKGNLWFGSIGSGVYYYNGRSFRNFTTKDGLLNNEVTCIYEDKAGDIWLGLNGGASRYDGKSFRNYMMDGTLMSEDKTRKTVPDFTRPPNEVSSIVEDKTGKVWFATRGNTFVYDGKAFAVLTNSGKPFTNVRCVIEDKKGNVWLGGNDGLWRYDGTTFTNFTSSFVGYIYEDRKGNLWTGSAGVKWELSRYDEKSLSAKMPSAPEVKSQSGSIFGILEDGKGNIWFGTGEGVRKL